MTVLFLLATAITATAKNMIAARHITGHTVLGKQQSGVAVADDVTRRLARVAVASVAVFAWLRRDKSRLPPASCLQP